MALEVLKCPNCGGRVPASVAGKVSACEFCGAVLSGVSLAPAPVAAPAPAPTPASAPIAAAPPEAPSARPLKHAQSLKHGHHAERAHPIGHKEVAASFTEDDLLSLARTRLGAHDSLYFEGNIPKGKLKAAYETHGANIGRVLVQYDDTLFGGADDGFVLTGAMLHWKNLAEDPKALRWSDIDPATVGAVDNSVTVGDQKIDVVLDQGKPMIAGLVRLVGELAAWARGAGAPGG